ncbi:MAG: GTP-binding protein [Candidatus Lokiarchaeota archaeon]|nr:GTP-binding protein [Candidatus Lokiarchaeota archaeon]
MSSSSATSFKVKLLLCGPAAVGKTSLIKRFVKNAFQGDYKLTIGVDILTKDVMMRNQEVATLSIWDVGGQKRFEFIRTTFYKGASGAILVFDLTRAETYQEVTEKWAPELIRNCGQIPFILIGNKADLVEKVGRVMDPQEAVNWANANGSIYLETSALGGQNVDEAFIEITERMRARSGN